MSSAPPAVGVIFGGPSPEHDVSVLTGLQAARALLDAGEVGEVHALYWAKSGEFYAVPATTEATAFEPGPPSGARAIELVVGEESGFVTGRGRLSGKAQRIGLAAVVVCCHGGPGEDGALQGALDIAGVAYTGPSATAAALGMDKLATAGVLRSGGLPVLDRVLLSEEEKPPPFAPPYIVKPRFGGSSIGIEVVEDHESALALARQSRHLRRGAVAEPYRPELFDLEIAVRTWPAREFSAIARPLRTGAGEILDYADKYVAGEGMAAAPRELPAAIDATLAEELRHLARRAAELLSARGVARIDFLSDGQALFVNEINTIPGSLARYLFVEPKLDFARLLRDLVDEAVASPAARFSAEGANGLVLRDAQSIAAKLA